MKAALPFIAAVGLACTATAPQTASTPTTTLQTAEPLRIPHDDIPKTSRSTTSLSPAVASPRQPRAHRSTVPPRPVPVRRVAPPVSRHAALMPGATPPVTSTSSGCDFSLHGYSVAQAHTMWDGLLDSYPWPHSTAFTIMYRESTGNPNACNRSSTARGLMQILGGPLNPSANVALAYRMYQQRGWQPWGM